MSADQSLLTELQEVVGANGLLCSPDDLIRYSTDWRDHFHGNPLCVVRPRTTDEVARVVRLCAANNIAFVPQSGNTGLAGGATPDGSGRQVLLSLERMNRVVSVDPISLSAEFEAGVVLSEAKRAVADVNRTLPISIAAEGSAMIGGVIAANAGGTNVVQYGMTRDFVLGLEIVLPSGEVVREMRRLRKNNAGVDWKQLFVGSEGIFGVITSAVLRIVPARKFRNTALLNIADLETVTAVFAHAIDSMGEALTAFELISPQSLAVLKAGSGESSPFNDSAWLVLLEANSSISGLKEDMEAFLMSCLENEWAMDGVVASTEAQSDSLWSLRETITEAEARIGPSLKHDVSVPTAEIPPFLSKVQKLFPDYFETNKVSVFGHVGDGNLHVNFLIDGDQDPTEIQRRVHDVVHEFNGSISAEHGIGQYRVQEWLRLSDRQQIELVTKLKHTLDPGLLCNPGKVIPQPEH